MIEYIRGVLADKELTHVAIEAHGVGYAVNIPISTYEKLPESGKEATVYIHYYMREDDVKLYGFATKTEREIFRHLITVNSVGPKVAMSIMSGVSIASLVTYVNVGDTAALKKIPGVGPKMAERLVVELRDKLKMYASMVKGSGASSGKKPAPKGRKEEAYSAMLSLGYNDKQVTKAIDRVEQEIAEGAGVDEWIRMALQVI